MAGGAAVIAGAAANHAEVEQRVGLAAAVAKLPRDREQLLGLLARIAGGHRRR